MIPCFISLSQFRLGFSEPPPMMGQRETSSLGYEVRVKINNRGRIFFRLESEVNETISGG